MTWIADDTRRDKQQMLSKCLDGDPGTLGVVDQISADLIGAVCSGEIDQRAIERRGVLLRSAVILKSFLVSLFADANSLLCGSPRC